MILANDFHGFWISVSCLVTAFDYKSKSSKIFPWQWWAVLGLVLKKPVLFMKSRKLAVASFPSLSCAVKGWGRKRAPLYLVCLESFLLLSSTYCCWLESNAMQQQFYFCLLIFKQKMQKKPLTGEPVKNISIITQTQSSLHFPWKSAHFPLKHSTDLPAKIA